MDLSLSALGVNNQSQELFNAVAQKDPTIATKRSKCDSMTSQRGIHLTEVQLMTSSSSSQICH